MLYISINDISVAVTLKDIKNLRISVYPTAGEVRVSAPLGMDAAMISHYVLSKMGWINKQRNRMLVHTREEQKFMDWETHYVWGRPCMLRIHPGAPKSRVNLENDILNIYVHGNVDKNRMLALLQNWHRQLVAAEGYSKMEYWRDVFKLPRIDLAVRRMRCRWGSCHTLKNKILLNTELAKKPLVCLDYVVAHELAHFYVPNHGPAFIQLMNNCLPDWKATRELLNSTPISQ